MPNNLSTTRNKMENENNHEPRLVPDIVFSDAENLKLKRDAAILLKEGKVNDMLTPHEGILMKTQSLLVWENPKWSAVMLLCVNGVVWMAAMSNYNVIFLIAITGISLITAETFYYKIWPDMKVHPPTPDEERWTALYIDLLTVRELSHYAAVAWQTGQEKNDQLWMYRKTNPGKFCLGVCIACLGLILLGQRFSGAFLSFLLLTSLLVMPAVIFRDLHKQAFAKLSPFLMQLEQSLNTPVHKTKKQKRRRKRASTSSGNNEDSSSSDSELAEFIPTPGPSLDAAFAHATAPYISTPGSSSRASPIMGLVGGLMPWGPSLEMTDEDLLTDNMPSFTLGELPAFDDQFLDLSDSRRGIRKRRVETEILYKTSDKDWKDTESDEYGEESEAGSTDDGAFEHELSQNDVIETESKNESGFIEKEDEGVFNSAGIDDSGDSLGFDETDINGLNDTQEVAQPQVTEPAQQPSFSSRTAADLLSQTVASVSAFISQSQREPPQTVDAPISSRTRSRNIPASIEPDLSEYEVLNREELDNTHNSRQEEQNQNNHERSFTEYFSNLFGRRV